jgi:hypothetical protein
MARWLYAFHRATLQNERLPIRQVMEISPLPAATGTAQNASPWLEPSGSKRAWPSSYPSPTTTSSLP